MAEAGHRWGMDFAYRWEVTALVDSTLPGGAHRRWEPDLSLQIKHEETVQNGTFTGTHFIQLVPKIEQTLDWVRWHSHRVKSELTPKQVSSVTCPTCGVPAGECCELHTGAPRSQPHVDRKSAALDAIDGKQTHLVIDECKVQTITGGSQICRD